ncbi:MAG: ricin-type beta-trefoil lectin domain protein, partial [Massilia sp.]
AQAILDDCNGGQNQTFARTARHQLAAYGNRCLVAMGAAPAAGAKLGLGECEGATPTAWEFAANGALTMNGLCLDAPAGAPPALAACDANSPTQRWTFSQ